MTKPPEGHDSFSQRSAIAVKTLSFCCEEFPQAQVSFFLLFQLICVNIVDCVIIYHFFLFIDCAVTHRRDKMQLSIRGQNTHVLECTGQESIAELKVHIISLKSCATFNLLLWVKLILVKFVQAKIAVLENLPVSELRLFSAGAPLEEESLASSLACATIDVTLPLLGGNIIEHQVSI